MPSKLPPRRQTTPDVALATVLALVRMRLTVRSCDEDTLAAREACEAIREVRARSAEEGAGIVEASRRLVRGSRELLRRSGQEGGPTFGPLGDQGQHPKASAESARHPEHDLVPSGRRSCAAA